MPSPEETFDSPEKNQDEQSLVERNRDNLSLYDSAEEQSELQRLTEQAGFPCKITPITEDELGMGYLVVPDDPALQQQIAAEAPITMMDFDDTQAMTTVKKYECWDQLEQLGLSQEIITHSDAAVRMEFGEEHGRIFEPELDMRLLTYALQHLDEENLAEELEVYLEKLLTYPSMKELKAAESVDPQIKEIFQQTRFFVELYPDTQEVLQKLRGNEEVVFSNVFVLTYGDSVFQFQKVLPLLQQGLVQGVILTKTRKGPLIKKLFEQKPFTELDITYQYPDRTAGKGIDLPLFQQPVILLDDDPKQVGSVNDLQAEMQIPLLAGLRVRSEDQKRADRQTIGPDSVVELNRDDAMHLQKDVAKIQRDLFAQAIEQFLASVVYSAMHHATEMGGAPSYDEQALDRFFAGGLTINPPSAELIPENAEALFTEFLQQSEKNLQFTRARADAAYDYRLHGETEYEDPRECYKAVRAQIVARLERLLEKNAEESSS